MAYLDPRRPTDRSTGDGTLGPVDHRHEDGRSRRAGDPRSPDRPPRPAPARGIFPRLLARPASHPAFWRQEPDWYDDRRRDVRRGAASARQPRVPGDEWWRLPGWSGAAQAGDDTGESAYHVVGPLL